MNSPEAQGISRREILKFLMAVGAGVVTGSLGKVAMDSRQEYLQYQNSHDLDPVLGIEFDKDNEHVSFDEIAQLHRKLGKAYTALGLDHWRPHMTEEFERDWVKEVAYQLVAENIATDVNIPPKDYYDPRTKMQINHELGNTDCVRRISENARYNNQASDFYDNPTRPGELVHETFHFAAQGGSVCNDREKFSVELVEATAQIGMLEVLAAMVNRGNRVNGDLPLKAFVYEFYYMVDGALQALAIPDRIQEYKAIRNETEWSAFDMAKEDKSERDWADDPFGLQDVLRSYYQEPAEKLIKAHRINFDIVEDVALPQRYTNYSYGSTESYPPTLVVKELAALMGHLDALVSQVETESNGV